MVKETSIVVVAPMKLPEGYEFDASFANKKISVVIPKGGVEEGDCLEIFTGVQDDNSETADSDETLNKVTAKIVPKKVNKSTKGKVGKKVDKSESVVSLVPEIKWRTGLCSCLKIIKFPLFWVSLFCPFILIGQLMQRSKLNYYGCRAENYQNTCSIISIFTFLMICAEATLVFLSFYLEDSIFWIAASAVFAYSIIILGLWSFLLRYNIRHSFTLPTTTALSKNCECFDDFFISIFCNFCSLIQMSRHTHDEKNHPYKFDSKTGLQKSAPEVYYF